MSVRRNGIRNNPVNRRLRLERDSKHRYPRRHVLRAAWLGALFLGLVPLARANFLSKFFAHDIDVITVTDMTDEGRKLPETTPKAPVYYMIIDLGQQPMGKGFNAASSWAGEKLPDSKEARKWAMAALQERGYLLADDAHPPTQLVIYCWGMLAGSDKVDDYGQNPVRPALKFLGGDKADLMWEQEWHGGFVDARVLLRGFQRMGVTGKIWDFSGRDLFWGRVRSFTIESLKETKPTMLWETRFACPAAGLSLENALPVMIKAAALQFGRETALPVNVNATKLLKGEVTPGELEVLGYEDVPEDKPASNPKHSGSDDR